MVEAMSYHVTQGIIGVLARHLVISWRPSVMFPSDNDTTARGALLTAATEQHPLFQTRPFYYSPAPTLLPTLPDSLLTIIAPVAAYWLTAGFFQILDLSNAPWLLRHRIHDSAEVSSRNRASRLQVFRAVVVQQVVQTALGLVWVTEHLERVDHAEAMRSIARALVALSPLRAFDSAATMVAPLAYLLYWWAIPAARFLLAMYVKSLLPPHSAFFLPLTH
jgi:sphinganine C4-monooxygenase